MSPSASSTGVPNHLSWKLIKHFTSSKSPIRLLIFSCDSSAFLVCAKVFYCSKEQRKTILVVHFCQMEGNTNTHRIRVFCTSEWYQWAETWCVCNVFVLLSRNRFGGVCECVLFVFMSEGDGIKRQKEQVLSTTCWKFNTCFFFFLSSGVQTCRSWVSVLQAISAHHLQP